MAAKLDDDEKQLIVVALIAMTADAPPDARESLQLQIASIVGKLDLREAAKTVLDEAARMSTPTKREDVG
jgi:hypothetical protein